MDDIDRAQARELWDTALALKAWQARAKPPPLAKLLDGKTGEELCLNYTEPLEPARLAKNPDIRLCLRCQDKRDQHRASRGHR